MEEHDDESTNNGVQEKDLVGETQPWNGDEGAKIEQIFSSKSGHNHVEQEGADKESVAAPVPVPFEDSLEAATKDQEQPLIQVDELDDGPHKEQVVPTNQAAMAKGIEDDAKSLPEGDSLIGENLSDFDKGVVSYDEKNQTKGKKKHGEVKFDARVTRSKSSKVSNDGQNDALEC